MDLFWALRVSIFVVVVVFAVVVLFVCLFVSTSQLLTTQTIMNHISPKKGRPRCYTELCMHTN